MEAFREMIKGRLGKFMLALLMLPFALAGIESYFGGGGASPAATVNGEDIPLSTLDNAVEKQKQDILASLGPGADASRIDNKVLREELLKKLTEDVLLKQRARKAGFIVSDADIGKIIAEETSFQENGVFSQSRYEQVLRGVGEDPATFPQRAKERIAQRQLMTGIVLTGMASGKEVERLNLLNTQQRDIHVATLAASRFLGTVQVTDADIDQEYRKHPDRYTSEDKVTAEFVALAPEHFQAAATVSEADIEQRYAERLKTLESNEQRQSSHILLKVDDKVKDAEALAKIQALEKRVKAGEDFGALAKEFSQDPGSAANNGDLGLSGRGMFVPEFEAALYALKVGEVSVPVKSQFGYHLIKLTAIQKAPVPAMADIRAELEAEARLGKSEDLFAEAVDKLDALAYESSDLKDLAAAYQLPVEVTAPFSRKGGEGVAADRKFQQSAFSDDLLKDGKNSAGIRLDDRRMVWLRVKNHEAAHLLPLAEVAPRIRLALQYDKASAMARTQAELAVKELAAGKSPADVAAAMQLQWMDFPGINRQATAPGQDILKLAFRLQAPKAGAWSAGLRQMGKDYAVVALSRVQESPTPLTAELRKQIMQSQAGVNGQQELMDYVQYLRGEAKIELMKSAEQ